MVVVQVWIRVDLVEASVDRTDVTLLRLITETGSLELPWDSAAVHIPTNRDSAAVLIFTDCLRLRIAGAQNLDVHQTSFILF